MKKRRWEGSIHCSGWWPRLCLDDVCVFMDLDVLPVLAMTHTPWISSLSMLSSNCSCQLHDHGIFLRSCLWGLDRIHLPARSNQLRFCMYMLVPAMYVTVGDSRHTPSGISHHLYRSYSTANYCHGLLPLVPGCIYKVKVMEAFQGCHSGSRSYLWS